MSDKTWNRAEFALLDRENSRSGTLSIYCKWDICNWSFGFRFEPDPGWYELNIDIGPISFSFCYWRVYT